MIRSLSGLAALLLAQAAAQAPASPPALPGQPATAAEARMLLERTKQEIAQEEKAWSEETAREKEAVDRRKQRLAEFTQDRQRLQQTLADQDQKLKQTMARLEADQTRARELQARFRRLGQALSGQARRWRPALAEGLPYRQEKRLETLDLLVRDLEGGNISPEEGMNRLWAFQQSERRLAQEAEVYSGDFSEVAGDPIQVKYLRVGKQLMAFSSLDGSRLGMLRRSVDSGAVHYAWVREADLDREAREAIKNAIATAEGKSVPGFVPVPVWRSAFAASPSAAADAPQGNPSPSAAKGPAAGNPPAAASQAPAAGKTVSVKGGA